MSTIVETGCLSLQAQSVRTGREGLKGGVGKKAEGVTGTFLPPHAASFTSCMFVSLRPSPAPPHRSTPGIEQVCGVFKGSSF